jgi:hypothetical protein
MRSSLDTPCYRAEEKRPPDEVEYDIRPEDWRRNETNSREKRFMVDPKAQQLSKSDVAGLFRYLDPMWIKTIMETFEGLMPDFIPNPNNYRPQLQAAGIFVDRMDLAMRAALNKKGQTTTWEVWESANDALLHKLPYQQRREIREFWFAGPTPGLSGGPASPAPLIGAPGEWFVTDLSGKSESLIVGAGYTTITGKIEFTNANGDVFNPAIGLWGLSLGASSTPNIGKVLSKIPGIGQILNRFPLLTQLLKSEEDAFAKGLVDILAEKSPRLVSVLLSNQTVKNLLEYWIKQRTAYSYGPTCFPSNAIGMVVGWDSTPLTKADFRGLCASYALTGAVGPGNAGVYALLFGINEHWNSLDPTQQSNGLALISAGSLSASIPSAGFAFNFFFGEIV